MVAPGFHATGDPLGVRRYPRGVVSEADSGDVTVLGRVWLAAEFLVLFVGTTALYTVVRPPGGPLPVLAVIATVAYVYLYRRPGFDRRNLWRREAVAGHWRSILTLWSVAVVVGVVAVGLVIPHRLFDLPREHPWLWLAVLVFYPLVSVYPQEVVFRAFIFERYRPLFGSGWWMVAVSAVTFGFVHLIYGNVVAVGLTLVGGVLFARHYQRTRSLLFTAIEHSLYGQLAFTIGLGTYLYHGAIR
jgi:membrane protease YdiL (CAAX protease family)